MADLMGVYTIVKPAVGETGAAGTVAEEDSRQTSRECGHDLALARYGEQINFESIGWN
jgi:hypothetical protein